MESKKLVLVLVWLVLASCCFAQNLIILSPVKDANGILKPFSINYQEPPGAEVGMVQATTNGRNPKYSLLDVVEKLPSGSSRPSWLKVAKDATRDDCDSGTLDNYTGLRKMFCIDHLRGIINTTEYFNLPPKLELHFLLHYKSQNFFEFEYPKNTPAITVNVVSRCDLMQSLVNQLNQSCNNEYFEITNQGEANNPKDVVIFELKNHVRLQQSEYYLTQVNVDFKHALNDEMEDGEPFNFTIRINNGQGMTLPKSVAFRKRTGITDREAVYLDFPHKVFSKTTTVEVRLYGSNKYVNGTSKFVQRKLKEKMVALVVLESRDFCTGNTFCMLMAGKFMSEYAQFKSECSNIDLVSFGPKYGFCQDAHTSPPASPGLTPIQKVFEVPFDSIKDTGTPTLIASEYLPFRGDNRNYIISIQSVSSSVGRAAYTRTKSTYKAIGHSKCTDRLFSGRLPGAFFCIDRDTGDLYTTNLVQKMSPGEIFIVAITMRRERPAVINNNNIEDASFMPPRAAEPEHNFEPSILNLTVRVVSICMRPYTLYRKMLRASCHAPCAYIAHLVPTATDTRVPNSGMQDSYNVTVQISRASFSPAELCPVNGISGGKYFISHMIRTSKARVPKTSDLGDFIRFKLSKFSPREKDRNSNRQQQRPKHQKAIKQTSEAVWFNRLSQVGLNTKITYSSLSHDNNDLFVLSATSYDHTTRTETAHPFDWAKWGVYLIPMDTVWGSGINLCVQKPKCQSLYAMYAASVKAKSVSSSPHTNYNVMCGDLDVHGLKTLYGDCAHYPAPRILKTKYLLERTGGAYSQIEVVPGGTPMYALPSYPMKYQLVSVTSPNKTFTTSNVDDIKKPKECTSGELGPNAPDSFFCMDERTGKIYTTSAIAAKLDSDVEFQFQIRIYNTSIYPIRDRMLDVVLTSLDPCKTVTPLYKNLKGCVRYSTVSLSEHGAGDSYIFEMPIEYQRIIALKVPLSNLQFQNMESSANKLNLSTSIKGFNDNGTVTLSYHSPYSLYYLEDVDLSIAAPVSFLGSNVRRLNITVMEGSNVTAIEGSNAGGPTVVGNKKSSSVESISLLYLNRFFCSDTCVAKFDDWRKKADNQSVEGANCKNDRLFYARNFDVCKAEKPKFTEKLRFSTQNLTVNAKLSITNCWYSAPYEYAEKFWMKNGVKINTADNLNVVPQRRRKRRYIDPDVLPNLPKNSLSDFVIGKLSLADQGTYKCGVRGTDGVEYLSQEIYLGLQDVAFSNVKITLTGDASKIDGNNFASKVMTVVNGNNASNPNLQVEYRGVERGGFSIFEFRVTYAGSHAVRENYCTTINSDTLRNGLQDEFDVLSFDITHRHCCVSVSEGDANFRGRYTFAVTLVSTSRHFTCEYGRTDNTETPVVRKCDSTGNGNVDLPSWETLNITACQPKTQTSQQLVVLQNVQRGDAVVVSKNLSTIVNGGSLTSRFDIEIVSDILETVVKKNAFSEEVAQNVLSTVDGIMNTNDTILVESNEKSGTSTQILSQLDTLATNQQATENALIIERPNIDFGIIKPSNQKPVVIIAKSTATDSTDPNNNATVKFSISQTDDQPDNTEDASIVLPTEVVKNASSIYSYLFKKPSLFLSRGGNFSVQSVVLSASVGNVTIRNLTNPVKLGFQTRKPNVTGLVNTCKFYDFKLQNTDNPWSTEGCRTIRKFGTDKVTCECDHLTNFAILLDVSQTGSNPLALQVITWIGCGISLAGLFLTIVTYLAFSKLRRKLPPKILISLSISLSAVLIIFLVGAEKTTPRVGCQVVAGLLHYFILSTFCWMAVEALNLYRNFVKVFSRGGSNFQFMVKSSIFAWGLPALITIATAVSRPDHLGPATENDAQFCVVRGLPFYFAVLLPVVMVLLGNIVVLVLVLRAIQDGAQLVKDSKAAKNKKMTQARIAFACAVLLGLTWVFAILAIGELRDFFQWLFCIFNSLQGFFIFIFYTLRSIEVRREWKRFFGFGPVDQNSSTGTGSSKYYSKYISVYRLQQAASIISRKKSQASSIGNNTDNESKSIKNKNAK